MFPSTAARIHTPSPIIVSSSETPLDGSALNALATQSQPNVASRPQRNRTPMPRGRQFQHEVRRSKALSAKIRQTKARKALGQGQGGGKGKGKRRASTPGSDTCNTDNDEDEDEDDTDNDGSWIVDDSSEVVPTSNPNELEQEGGGTFQTQLDDPEFCANLSERLTTLLKGENVQDSSSREALKKALRFADSLPEQPIEGGGGHHLDYEPQPGQKRRFVAPQIGSSKRGRLTTSGTPSTVLDLEPNPIPRPLFPVQPHPNSPSLPSSAADRDALGPSPHLPVSAAIPVPARSWSQPQVAGSQVLRVRNSELQDTQTVPDDTQTVPEDTQTVPEDTQTQPDDTQHMPMSSSSQPRASQPQGVASQLGRSPRPSAQPLAAAPHASVTPVGIRPSVNSPSARVLSRSASQLDTMSDRFDRNERHRARAHAILHKRKGGGKRMESDDGELMEEDAADRAEARNMVMGKPAKRKKSGLNCQPGRPRDVATRAVTDVTAYSFAKGPYFTCGTGLIWSLEAYDRAAAVEFPGKPVDPAIPELISAICDRIAGGCTVLKSGMHSSIVSSYGFKQNPVLQKEIDKNLKIYNDIHEDFHFGSLDDPQSHYEHPGLTTAFLGGFFAARHSPCVVYSHYFNPVSVEAFVTLLVMMDACIAEWRTGTQINEHLNSGGQKVLYDKHMASVQVFAQGAPDRFYRLRKGLYEAGMNKMALAPGPDSSIKPSIRSPRHAPSCRPRSERRRLTEWAEAAERLEIQVLGSRKAMWQGLDGPLDAVRASTRPCYRFGCPSAAGKLEALKGCLKPTSKADTVVVPGRTPLSAPLNSLHAASIPISTTTDEDMMNPGPEVKDPSAQELPMQYVVVGPEGTATAPCIPPANPEPAETHPERADTPPANEQLSRTTPVDTTPRPPTPSTDPGTQPSNGAEVDKPATGTKRKRQKVPEPPPAPSSSGAGSSTRRNTRSTAPATSAPVPGKTRQAKQRDPAINTGGGLNTGAKRRKISRT